MANVAVSALPSGTATGGETFVGNQSGTTKKLTIGADALSDYEEGTWSAVLSDASASGNDSPTATTTATYVRIGNLCHLFFTFLNIDTTGMTSGNDLYLLNLPFTAKTYAGPTFTPGSLNHNFNTTNTVHPTVISGATNIRFAESLPNNASFDYITVGDLNSGTTDIRCYLCYEID